MPLKYSVMSTLTQSCHVRNFRKSLFSTLKGVICMFEATIVLLALQEAYRCQGYNVNSFYCGDQCGSGCNESGGSGQGGDIFVCNGDLDI